MPPQQPERGPLCAPFFVTSAELVADLSPAVVPSETRFAIGQSSVAEETGLDKESEVLTERIEMDFPGGG